ncbi:hypothetical protein BGX34_011969 [Mortierella sp. NVP85]|nr:hypothetical protein BGX34_011969 [Mortierella sp. NVP85]
MEQYNYFKINDGESFWTARQTKYGLKIVAKKAAVSTAKAGLYELEEEYSTYSHSRAGRKRSPDALYENEDGGNEQVTESIQKDTAQLKETTIDSVEGLAENALDAVETSSQIVDRRQSKKPRKANQRQSMKTSTTGCAKKTSESTGVNILQSRIPRTVSDAARIRRIQRFQRLDASKFWRLSTGTRVDEVLFKASLSVDATIKYEPVAVISLKWILQFQMSYTIDFECQATRKLFTPEEWIEIEHQNTFALPQLPKTTVTYLLKVKQAIIDRQPVADVSLPKADREERMYRKVPSPFVVHGLTEAYWGRKSWPILMDLLEDLDNIFMIDGEKMGLESSRRRNNGRQWKPDTKAPRKLMGRKLDLIARDVQDQKDWMIVERMKNWDEVSNKFLKESNCDLFRETHTIMTSRVRDTVNKGFRDESRFFGVYTRDRGFQSFELRPAGIGSYISLFKQYPVYELPTLAADMKAHVQGIAHLLQLRLCMLKTIEAYRRTEQGSEEQGNNWIYGNIRDDRYTETTLASSPITSPIASPSLPHVTTSMLVKESYARTPDPLQDMDGDDIDNHDLYSDDD